MKETIAEGAVIRPALQKKKKVKGVLQGAIKGQRVTQGYIEK